MGLTCSLSRVAWGSGRMHVGGSGRINEFGVMRVACVVSHGLSACGMRHHTSGQAAAAAQGCSPWPHRQTCGPARGVKAGGVVEQAPPSPSD